ncbi:MAG: alpha/beta hydrolase [Steroidobacteraceae bacterium]
MDVIVYIHGLWFGGAESLLLRRRICRTLDARWHSFSYSSVGATLTQNAAALGRYLSAIPAAGRLHLIAHSLGGLVLLELFETTDVPLPPGRIVLLGSPVRGSRAAQRLARVQFGRRLLGRTAGEALIMRHERRWGQSRDLGVIAGFLGHGLGRLLGPLPEPHDGTVAVEETDLPGASQQLQLPVSHSGLLFSSMVADHTATFLRDGRFGTLTQAR